MAYKGCRPWVREKNDFIYHNLGDSDELFSLKQVHKFMYRLKNRFL